jgi:hypothetical protein
MSERDEFEKAIENLIDQMIALLPEEMQSTVRKQLAHQREVAWMARAEATKAQEEQKRLEAEAKIAADSAEQELMRLLVSSLSRHLGQTDPGNVKNDVELILKLNEKYTEFEVAKAKCRKDLPSDGIDRDHLTGLFNTQYLNKILIEEIARAEDLPASRPVADSSLARI